MRVTIEVDVDQVMETIGVAVIDGAIDHWGHGAWFPRDGDRAPYIDIRERLQGRRHIVRHHLGEQKLRAGLRSNRVFGLAGLETGTSPNAFIDRFVQHCLFQEVLYPDPERVLELPDEPLSSDEVVSLDS